MRYMSRGHHAVLMADNRSYDIGGETVVEVAGHTSRARYPHDSQTWSAADPIAIPCCSSGPQYPDRLTAPLDDAADQRVKGEPKELQILGRADAWLLRAL